MAEYKSFVGCIKNIESQVNLSKKQALNKAISKTKTKYAKDIADEIGITSTRGKERARTIQASANRLTSTLSIGTKYLFRAHDFKSHKHFVQTSRGARYGAVIEVGRNGPLFLGPAFIAKGKSSGKAIIIQRVGAKRIPITTTMVDVFIKGVEAIKPGLESYAADQFGSIFISQLNYNLSK